MTRTKTWTCPCEGDPDCGSCGGNHVRELPASWNICSGCHGEGRSSAHLGWFTMDDLREDPDFAEEYMAGAYDVCCDQCGGSGKTLDIDWDLVERQDPELRKAADELAEEMWRDAQMRAAEMRMGC